MQASSLASNNAHKSTWDPRAFFGIAAVVLFFVASGAFAYLNIRTLRDDNQLIIHTHEVMSALQGVLTTAQDAETGQRGFLLTNNARYLEPYNTAVDSIAARLNDIENLTLDNPRQQKRLRDLRLHVEAKMAELRETIELRRNQGLDAALAVVTTDRGKTEMDAVRAYIASMIKKKTTSARNVSLR